MMELGGLAPRPPGCDAEELRRRSATFAAFAQGLRSRRWPRIRADAGRFRAIQALAGVPVPGRPSPNGALWLGTPYKRCLGTCPAATAPTRWERPMIASQAWLVTASLSTRQL